MSHNVKRLPVRLRALAAKVFHFSASQGWYLSFLGSYRSAQPNDKRRALSPSPAAAVQAARGLREEKRS
jgi:hypothetical protein